MKTMATALLTAALLVSGCAYKGGKVIDGTNLEIGLSVPGTDGALTINALSYTGGLRVCGDERTIITVTNEVAETNSYFGLVRTNRRSKMWACITPVPTNNVMYVPCVLAQPPQDK